MSDPNDKGRILDRRLEAGGAYTDLTPDRVDTLIEAMASEDVTREECAEAARTIAELRAEKRQKQIAVDSTREQAIELERRALAAEAELERANAALREETKRRCFMSVTGTNLSWGPGSRNDSAGKPHVYIEVQDGDGPYRHVYLEEPSGDDLAAAERRLIDRAIERVGLDRTPSWRHAARALTDTPSTGGDDGE